MALLNMVREKGYAIEAAHVNYHKRKTADRDEKTVRVYCERYGIPFHRKDVYPKDVKGNFQAYARKVRYQYFANLCRRYHLDGVVTAHQQDDLLETFLMQKEKKLGVEYYGLKEETDIEGVRVLRPLLGYTKEELLAYCEEKKLDYGIDESNLTDVYARNRIRHHSKELLSEKERKQLLKEIEHKNKMKQKELERVSAYPEEASYTVKQFMKLPYLKTYLRMKFPHSSDRKLEEMIRQLKESEKCHFSQDRFHIVKEYGRIDVFTLTEEGYEYRFTSLKRMKKKEYGYFSLSDKGGPMEGVTLKEDDFPIIIRNAREKDHISMRYGKRKLNRFFIDAKIPLRKRLTWPVMVNREGNVILVPGIGCDRLHYSEKHNMFMIEL